MITAFRKSLSKLNFSFFSIKEHIYYIHKILNILNKIRHLFQNVLVKFNEHVGFFVFGCGFGLVGAI